MPSPQISIVIPTYQRPDSLRACLSGIIANRPPGFPWEAIVVDDASAEDPAGIVAPFAEDFPVTLMRQPENGGPAAARNAGAARARGEYLLFIDDDCIPDRHWLQRLDGHLQQHVDCAVGGTCRNALEDSIYSEAQQMLMEFLYSYYNRDPSAARFCPTNNLAVPRRLFLEAGGFDTSFRFAAGEDREFSTRWRQLGHDMVFVQDVPVFHQHAMGLRSFLRMHYHYGRGARRYRVRRRLGGGRPRFEPASFYWGLVTFPLQRRQGGKALTLCLLQVLSQVAHAAGYLRERGARGAGQAVR